MPPSDTRPAPGARASSDARSSRYALGFLGAVALLLAVVARHPSSERGAIGAPLWGAPVFSFTDHTGRNVSDASLRGTPYVASFFFTRCPTACPLLTSKLVRLQQRSHGERLAFVSFSLDPEHDTARVLRDFAQAWNPSEARWHLLRTEPGPLRDALTGFRVTARQTTDPASPIIHSSAFFLVDAGGFVRGVYPSDEARALERLERDALVLARGAP